MSGVWVLALVAIVPWAGADLEVPSSQPAELWAWITSPSADPDWGPADNEAAGRLVRQLADPDYAKREEAATRLKTMGPGVFGLLAAEYRASRDLEKRLRIRQVASELYLQTRLPWFDEGFLGIQMRASPQGVRIDQVLAGTAAAAAGLRMHDVVVAIDGQTIPVITEYDGNPIPPVADTLWFRDSVSSRKAGATVHLQVLRQGQVVGVSATLGRRGPRQFQEPQRQLDFQQANAEFKQRWEALFDAPPGESGAEP